jgi:hypothetical protein
MKQTALDIFFSKLGMHEQWVMQHDFEQAKEMEKEQIENAYQAGQDNVDYTASFVDENGLENYYQKTYGGNNAE